MKTIKLRAVIVTVFLILSSIEQSVAQDKYEYATIIFSLYNQELSVSINGKEFSKVYVNILKADYSIGNSNPLLLKVNEFQDGGWEVLSLSTTALASSSMHIAYMRRKKI